MTTTLENECKSVRRDSGFVDIGEDDEFLIELVSNEEDVLGLVGFGQYDAHGQDSKPLRIDGIVPAVQTIANGEYPLSRPLYLYVKVYSLERNSAVQYLLEYYFSEEVIGQNGLLASLGLIPPDKSHLNWDKTVLREKRVLTPDTFSSLP